MMSQVQKSPWQGCPQGRVPGTACPFSVSGEYARFASPDGTDWRLLTELFTTLKRTGASQVITYAAVDLAGAIS